MILIGAGNSKMVTMESFGSLADSENVSPSLQTAGQQIVENLNAIIVNF